MRAAKVWVEVGGRGGWGKDSRLIIQYGQMGLRQLTDGILNRTALLHILTRHLQDCFQHTSAPNQHLHTKGITPHSKEGGGKKERTWGGKGKQTCAWLRARNQLRIQILTTVLHRAIIRGDEGKQCQWHSGKEDSKHFH